jgi:hypothetical protein
LASASSCGYCTASQQSWLAWTCGHRSRLSRACPPAHLHVSAAALSLVTRAYSQHFILTPAKASCPVLLDRVSLVHRTTSTKREPPPCVCFPLLACSRHPHQEWVWWLQARHPHQGAVLQQADCQRHSCSTGWRRGRLSSRQIAAQLQHQRALLGPATACMA